MINVLFSVSNVLDTSVVSTTALVNEVSSFTITGRGGQAPYIWLVTPPAGVGTLTEILNGPALTVSFVPQTPGTVVFTVRITDARRVTKARTVSIEVIDPFAELLLGTEDGKILGLDDPFITDGVLGVDGAIAPPA